MKLSKKTLSSIKLTKELSVAERVAQYLLRWDCTPEVRVQRNQVSIQVGIPAYESHPAREDIITVERVEIKSQYKYRIKGTKFHFGVYIKVGRGDFGLKQNVTILSLLRAIQCAPV